MLIYSKEYKVSHSKKTISLKSHTQKYIFFISVFYECFIKLGIVILLLLLIYILVYIYISILDLSPFLQFHFSHYLQDNYLGTLCVNLLSPLSSMFFANYPHYHLSLRLSVFVNGV